jgi:hypothetical protein
MLPDVLRLPTANVAQCCWRRSRFNGCPRAHRAAPSLVLHSVLALAAAILVGLEARWAQLIDRPA